MVFCDMMNWYFAQGITINRRRITKGLYNKKMKKIISLVVVLTMLMSLVTCSYAGENNKAKGMRVLLNSGWTVEEINDLLSDKAIKSFANAKPAKTTEKKYFKVSEDSTVEVSRAQALSGANEANKQDKIDMALKLMVPNVKDSNIAYAVGDIEKKDVVTTDGYLEYYAQSYDLGNGEFILSARYEWLKEPINRKEDVFGLGHDTNLTQVSSFEPYFVYKTDITEVVNGRITNKEYVTNTPDGIKIDTGGTVTKHDMYNDFYSQTYTCLAENHRGYLQYKVKVNNSNVNTVAIYTEYLHQESTFSVSPAISYPAGAAISINYSTKFKAMSPNPYLSFQP